MPDSFVRWVERSSFFARPRQLDTSNCTNDSAEEEAFSSCRELAAWPCPYVPEDATHSADACVCSTFADYNSVFSGCIFLGPYSNCIHPENDQTMSSWSEGHCGAVTTTSFKFQDCTGCDEISSTPPPDPPSSTTVPGTSSSDPPPEQPSSSSEESTEPSTLESSDLQSSSAPPPSSAPEPPSSSEEPSSTPAPSSEQSSEKPSSSKTPEVTPTSAPKPSLVPVTFAPRVSAETTGSFSSTSTPVSITRWAGKGVLLQGYCATPEYTILDGPTAYWAPVVGCMGDRPDCCPFDIPVPTQVEALALSSGSATTSTSGDNAPTGGSGDGFPSALSPAQATLDACPDDYHSIANGCCPSNYFPWSAAFGGQTPCYSTLPIAQTPPPLPGSLAGSQTTASQKPTSAIVNVVYAMQYPVKESKKPALATNAKIGIGAGSAGAALVFGILIWLLIWKHRAHKRDKAALESLSGFGPGLSSTRQSVAASNAGGSQTGGVREWRKSVPPPPGGRFHEGLEPSLPSVGMTAAYPADWRPGQRSMSPPAPYAPSSPSIPEGYSEVDSQQGILDRRWSSNTTPVSTNRSELYSGEYPFPRQELQGVPEGQAWQENGQAWDGGIHAQYHEAPSGRM